jgi:hypothetical protein
VTVNAYNDGRQLNTGTIPGMVVPDGSTTYHTTTTTNTGNGTSTAGTYQVLVPTGTGTNQ